jgi:hypothetical protein
MRSGLAAAAVALVFLAAHGAAITAELFTQPGCGGTGQKIDPLDIYAAVESNEDFKVESNKYKSLKLQLSGGDGSAESVCGTRPQRFGDGGTGSTSSSPAARTRAR